MIKAFGYNISEEAKETIKNIAKNVLKDDVTTVDIRHQRVMGLTPTDILLVFGSTATKIMTPMIEQHGIRKYILLPELDKLIPSKGDTATRKDVLERLRSFEKIMKEEQALIITKESLSNLNIKEIEKIKDKKREWVGILEDGRSIRLSEDLPPDNKYQINMTFSELVALKLAMEQFNIKGFHLI